MTKLSRRFLTSILSLGYSALIAFSAIAADMHDHQAHMQTAQTKEQLKKYIGQGNAVKKTSQNGEYLVSLYCSESKIPLKKIHQWIVHIEDKQGKPINNAKVNIFGGMPVHKHGFPTKPIVKKYLGNGDYLVEGIKFNMLGPWEMGFDIRHKGKRDRVVYDINLAL